MTARGHPYLEPHHTRRLSDGGPDDYHHVIALCPTRHRRVHHAADGDSYNAELRVRLGIARALGPGERRRDFHALKLFSRSFSMLAHLLMCVIQIARCESLKRIRTGGASVSHRRITFLAGTAIVFRSTAAT